MKIKEVIMPIGLSLLVGFTTIPQQPNQAEEGNCYKEQVQADGVPRLTIWASGDVYVLVKTTFSNERLFRDTLSEGESATIEVDDSVDVLFTAGERLVLEWKGEEFKPNSGTAKITLE